MYLCVCIHSFFLKKTKVEFYFITCSVILISLRYLSMSLVYVFIFSFLLMQLMKLAKSLEQIEENLAMVSTNLYS